MASRKQRRKNARQAQKQKLPSTGPFVHADGDRRHRNSFDRKAYLREHALLKSLGKLPQSDENQDE